MKYYYNQKYKRNAQNLRKNMTPQEGLLWHSFLKANPVQFRRQKQFGNYIVDFYCARAKLVVELDGDQHFSEEGLAYDTERTEYLEGLGLRVVRFSNWQIKTDFRGVCEKIDWVVRERTSSTTA